MDFNVPKLFVLVLMLGFATCASSKMSMHMHAGDSSTYSPFFTTSDLKLGARMALKFPTHATPSYFLPEEQADSIPFSLEKLPEILAILSLPPNSPQAKDVEASLRACKSSPIEGETKFCATSMESLVRKLRYFFRRNTPSLLTSAFVDRPRVAFQNFTIVEVPTKITASEMMGCHVISYPYTVFYCHHFGGRDRVFEALLDGDNGDRVRGVAACHDTIAQWDAGVGAFRKLRVPERPVCHFFPPHGNLLWIHNGTSGNESA